MWEKFKRAQSRLVKTQRATGIAIALTCPVLVVVQIILRLFNRGSAAILEVLGFLIIWLYMIGAANTSQARSHIECGILTLYMKKERTIAITTWLKSLLCVVTSVWLCYWGIWYVNFSIHSGQESAILCIPMAFGESAVLVGISLMTIYSVVDLIRDTQKIILIFKNTSEKGGER